jgi:excisionase family DNA binding protein
MKAELTLPQEIVDLIADKVVEKLKPIISCNGKHDTEDVIFDVQGLMDYLKVSKQWIYERTHLKEIPHLKIDGQLRFRKKDIDKWLSSYNVPTLSTQENILKAVRKRRAVTAP